jgi:hypothetical protein
MVKCLFGVRVGVWQIGQVKESQVIFLFFAWNLILFRFTKIDVVYFYARYRGVEQFS